MTRRASIALAGWLAASAGQAATVRVELEPREPTIGDRVRARLLVEAAPGELAGEPRFPAWGKTWGEAEIVEAQPPAADGTGGYRQELTLAPFRIGDVPLPPMVLALPGGGELRTASDLALRVRSVLPAGEAEPQPKPPAPARPLPWGRRFWWTLASGLGLCLACAAALLWRRRRALASATSTQPSLPPLAELLARLSEIESATQSPLERSHTALSLALRRYLGRALDFPAAESTTSEISRQLRSRHLPGELAQRAGRVLRDCDGVKFARGESTAGELAARVATAREIGRGIDGHLQPPVPLEASA